MTEAAATEGGKRVSWVELYFDLIFVFAVSQAARDIAERPTWSGLGIAFGVFLTLWWTWIGFVVLYNRNVEDRPSRRLFVLAATLPCAVAAVQLQNAPEGDLTGFTLSLAAARVILAVAYPVCAPGSATARRAGVGYGLSTVLFVAAALVGTPWRSIIVAVALLQEAGFLLLGSARRGRRDRRRRTWRSRTDALREAMRPPEDPDKRVDAAHLAERFGLFMIILLGEIVVSVGTSALGVPERTLSFWLGLLSGLVLAAALWWIYFDSAASINEYVLRASGGNPAMAYGIYAGGHLAPAFALLAIAAGVSLSLHGHSSRAAGWFVAAGLAAYLIGTRAFPTMRGTVFGRVLRFVGMAATVCLGLLERVLSPTAVVAAVTLWAVGAAAIVSWRRPGVLSRLSDDPLSLFHRP